MEKVEGTSAESGMDKTLEVGDLVFHDGERDYYVIGTGRRGWEENAPTLVQFENVTKKVTCLLDDLVYSEQREAWYLPGRLLPKEIRKNQRDRGYDPLEIEKELMGTQESRHG